jgi:hypothetical protein|tara:strand:- start:4133 stop:4645 length:513 start_codon:yes stop_codon:yes gene_type:complete
VVDEKDNIIQFPSNKIVRNLGGTTEPSLDFVKKQTEANDKIKHAQTKAFVESSVDNIVMNLINSFLDIAIKTDKITFTKDLAMVVDSLRGLIYRDFGMKHTSHSLIDKIVQVKQMKNGHRSATIDYSRVMETLKPTRPFNKEIKEELDDLTNGAGTFFESDEDLGNDDDK